MAPFIFLKKMVDTAELFPFLRFLQVMLEGGCRGAASTASLLAPALGSKALSWRRGSKLTIVFLLIGALLLLSFSKEERATFDLSLFIESLISLVALFLGFPLPSRRSNLLFALLSFIVALLVALGLQISLRKCSQEDPLVFAMRFCPYIYATGINLSLALLIFRIQGNFAVAFIVAVLTAISTWALCVYFGMPWLKRRAFVRYPPEFLDFFALPTKTLAGTTKTEEMITEEQDEVLGTVIYNQAEVDSEVGSTKQAASGIVLPASVMTRLKMITGGSPQAPKPDIENQMEAQARREPSIVHPTPSIHQQHQEWVLQGLRAEVLYGPGLAICALLMLASEAGGRLNDAREALAFIVTLLLGAIAMGGRLGRHLGRTFLPLAPSTAFCQQLATLPAVMLSGPCIASLGALCGSFISHCIAPPPHLSLRPMAPSEGSNASRLQARPPWLPLAILVAGSFVGLLLQTCTPFLLEKFVNKKM